jgi:glutamate synthase (NADPH/NADH) large chain
VVVEGCGSNGCEYMTGGTAVILGPIGDNFGAGMTGGMAFIYDPEDLFHIHVNPESVIHQRIESAHWESVLKSLVAEYVKETGSAFAQSLLDTWDAALAHFWQVCPKEMMLLLEHALTDAPEARSA